MQCACVTLVEKLRERLNLLCTFPGGHWIRVNIPSCGLPFLTRDLRGGEMETRSEHYDET